MKPALALVSEVSDRREQLSIVARLGQYALEGAEPDALFRRAVELICEALDLDCGAVLEVQPDRVSLRFRAAFGWDAGIVCAELPILPDSMAAYVLATGTPVTVRDYCHEARFVAPPALRARGLRSGISVSIPGGDRVYGLLGAHTTGLRTFTVQDVDLVQSVAHLLGLTVKRQWTAAALRDSVAQNRLLIENSQDLIAELDSAGRILFVSPSVERILGWRPDVLTGQDGFDLIHPEEIEAVRTVQAETVATPGVPRCLEIRLRHRDGSWRSLETSGIAAPAANGEIRVILNARDVTDRKSLERQLLQAQKMEAMGQLSGGVAHDFNNLLTVITGFSQLIMNQMEEENPLADFVREISGAGERAAALTRQLLAFSRKQLVSPCVLDLNEIVLGMEMMLRRLIGEDILLETRLGPGCRIKADRGQMEQVILNLAVNARDAMPDGGRLQIVTQAGSSGAVAMEVIDSGHGMPPEVQDRIFEPFFTTKEPGKGTGLGLSTVYGIVQQSGGQLLVDSSVGQGTRFRILLPDASHEPAPSASVRSRPGGPSRGEETILVTEDEEAVRHYANVILRRLGYRVLLARDGNEALRILQEQGAGIDLLLTDTIMPGMNGRQLAERAVESKPDLKVLYMSGYTDDALLRAGVQSERVAFLAKPFRQEVLARKLREVLEAD